MPIVFRCPEFLHERPQLLPPYRRPIRSPMSPPFCSALSVMRKAASFGLSPVSSLCCHNLRQVSSHRAGAYSSPTTTPMDNPRTNFINPLHLGRRKGEGRDGPPGIPLRLAPSGLSSCPCMLHL